MKIAKIIGLLLLWAFLGMSCGYADDTYTFPITANIPQQLELKGWVKEMAAGQADPGTEGTEVSFPCTMAFGDSSGNLTDELSTGDDAGCLYSPTWYAVFLTAKTSGRAYKIQSVATSISGTGDALGYNLDKSFVLTPSYKEEDEWQWIGGSAPQGPDPNNGTVGTQTLAEGTHEVYNSASGGAGRIIRAFYSLPPYPDPDDPVDIQARPGGWEPVSKDQHHGQYQGTVTISLILTSP
ncbi:MAG: hypothetical protein ISS44_04105 [Candidatus Omnitrophica bacterium]|nr:hypothetical protein [Candidatus Omnitrophota bacterium]